MNSLEHHSHKHYFSVIEEFYGQLVAADHTLAPLWSVLQKVDLEQEPVKTAISQVPEHKKISYLEILIRRLYFFELTEKLSTNLFAEIAAGCVEFVQEEDNFTDSEDEEETQNSNP